MNKENDLQENNKLATEARRLLLSKSHGVLSTQSQEVPGYPFGSITVFCLDADGLPCIYISTLAQHTKNILSNPKLSLTLLESEAGDVQNQGRLTILADAEPVSRGEKALAERYYRFFPDARQFAGVHDFSFYRLKPVRIRFIGGFGNISWVEAKDFLRANPFSASTEERILTHMNQDHAKSLRHYLRAFKQLKVADDAPVTMVGIDAEGFHLRWENQIQRVVFEAPIETTEEARSALVKMTKV